MTKFCQTGRHQDKASPLTTCPGWKVIARPAPDNTTDCECACHKKEAQR